MFRLFGRPRNRTIRISKEKQQGIVLMINDATQVEIKIGNAQHQGARRTQEDSFGYAGLVDGDTIRDKGLLAVLADGMGGLSNGKAISEYVVSSFIQMFTRLVDTVPPEAALRDIALKINEEVCKNFCKGGKSDAGSTVVAALVCKTKLHWLCIGDSRLYVLRNGHLFQVNEDHDYFNQLLLDHIHGEVRMEAIQADPQKDSLSSYIGSESLPFVDSSKKGLAIFKGDSFLLCSDGVYNGLTDAEMVAILKQNEPQRASEKIAQAVLDKNIAGQDNLTAMVIRYE